jgi:hypothetical protein
MGSILRHSFAALLYRTLNLRQDPKVELRKINPPGFGASGEVHFSFIINISYGVRLYILR